MNLITILDENFKKLRFIKNAENPLIRVTLSGEYIFNFQTTAENLEYINTKNYVEADDELFKIQRVKTYRTLENELFIDVYCEQVSYLLLNPEYTIDSFNYVEGEDTKPIDLSYALKNLLLGTGFTYNIDNTKEIPFHIREKTTIRDALMKLLKCASKEISFHKFDITLKDKIGCDNGVQFRVKKNLQGISKEVDDTKRDEKGNPAVTYEIDVVDLSSKYPFETVNIGDIVRVIDNELKINIKTRVLEKEYNPILKTTSRIVLSNAIPDFADYSLNVQEQLNETNNNLVETNDKLNKNIAAVTLEIKKTNEALSITAKDLRQADNELSSKIEITAEKLSSDYIQKITDVNKRVTENESKITQTAKEIRLEISQKVTNLDGRIDDAFSSIRQTASEIESFVSSTNSELGEMSSRISQQANKISMVVDGRGNINSASIVAAIVNDQSSIELIADNISLQPKSNVIWFPNGCSVDCRDGVARFRKDRYNYIYVDEEGLTIYTGGSILAYITEEGIFWKGQQVI